MMGIGTHKLQLEHKVSTKGITENQGHLSRRGRTIVQSMGIRGKDHTVRLETRGDMIKTKVYLELTQGSDPLIVMWHICDSQCGSSWVPQQ